MDQIELRAYETLGFWSIAVIVVSTGDDGQVTRAPLYLGDHVPIDDEDPLVRTVLLLSQVASDLTDCMSPSVGHNGLDLWETSESERA